MSQEFDPTRPIYLQIMEAVKKSAARGEYPSGGKLPSVREMAKLLQVNSNTMSRAYMELEREGFIITRRGEGSFISENPDRIEDEQKALAKAALQQFVAEIRSLDLGPDQIGELLQKISQEVAS